MRILGVIFALTLFGVGTIWAEAPQGNESRKIREVHH